MLGWFFDFLLLVSATVWLLRLALNGYLTVEQILVIMSDMIEETDRLNLLKTPPDNKKTEMFISRQRAENRLPDLSGVTVYVVGVTAKNQELYYKIQSFWMKYFKACVANLKEYGRTLLNFEE
ncbi:MAG: hypothetical protein HY578_02650 [Nitrospinae bacterium]|nr:hypothetical protein [Nitrospinota bacterium]